MRPQMIASEREAAGSCPAAGPLQLAFHAVAGQRHLRLNASIDGPMRCSASVQSRNFDFTHEIRDVVNGRHLAGNSSTFVES